jgi:F-type H+-transporting ATPase subunit gamma
LPQLTHLYLLLFNTKIVFILSPNIYYRTYASTKLHRARAQLEGVRPIYRELKGLVEDLRCEKEAQHHQYYKEREVQSSLYIILTSDRGFSGAYNANIMSEAISHMSQGKNEKILIVGSKGKEYFKRKKKNIIRAITDVDDTQVYYGSESVAKWTIELFLSQEVDEVFLAYTEFENILNHIPRVERLLPIGITSQNQEDKGDNRYEQGINVYMDYLIPLYLHMSLFRAISESHTSEHASRMISMDSAGKNGQSIGNHLNLPSRLPNPKY